MLPSAAPPSPAMAPPMAAPVAEPLAQPLFWAVWFPPEPLFEEVEALPPLRPKIPTRPGVFS